VVADDGGPHVRLGVAWALVLLAAGVLGTAALAPLLAATAAMAAVETARSRAGRLRPAPLPAGVGAAVVVVAAAGGGLAVAAAAVFVAVAGPAWVVAERVSGRRPSAARAYAPVPTAALAVVLGVPVACVVLVRGSSGATVTAVLLCCVLLFDASVFIVGTGAANGWEGPAAGIVTIVPLSVIVGSLLSPPFTGSGAWVLGGVAVVTLPMGGPVARRMLGDRAVPAPALGRVDTMLVTGPAWAVAAALLHVH